MKWNKVGTAVVHRYGAVVLFDSLLVMSVQNALCWFCAATMSRSNSARSVGSQGRPARGSSGDSGRAVSENQESLGALPQSDTINAAAAGASSAQASPRTGAEEKVHANSSSSGDSAGADGGAGSDDETDDEDGIDDGYTSEASESADGSAASGGELEEDGRVAVGAAPVRQRGGSEFVILEQPLEPFRDMPAPLANAIFSVYIFSLEAGVCASVCSLVNPCAL